MNSNSKFSREDVVIYAPVAPSIDGSLLADPADNTMKSQVLTDDATDIVLTVQDWGIVIPPGLGLFDQMWLIHKPTGGVEEELHSDEYDTGHLPNFPLPIKLNKSQVKSWGEGGHSFFIRVVPYNGGAPQDSPSLNLIFDRVGPYPNQFPTAFPAIPAVLDANLAAVTLTLPKYDDWAAKDSVGWIWRKEIPVDPGDMVPDGTALVTAVPMQIPIPQKVITDLGDGGIFAAYILQDKAGNVSGMSAPTRIAVALGPLPLPADFKKPVVLGMNAGVVDQAAVLKGIEIEVAGYANYKPTDLITIAWDVHSFEERPVGNFPIKLAVPAPVVLASYGKGGVGEKTIEVAYTVRRGDHPLGGEKDGIKVNLERLGPVVPDPDPEWPGPVNPVLLLPDVFGGSDGLKNQLTENDERLDATLKVTIDASFKANDVVKFYYTGEHVLEADYPLKTTDIGKEVEVTIPWDYILRHDNGSRFAYYEVSRTGVPNTVASKPQAIQVEAIVLHPDAPAFLGGQLTPPVGWLVCSSLFDPADPSDTTPDVRVEVPDLTQWGVAADAEVTLTWTVLHGLSGSTDIPDAEYQEVITLDASAYPVTGFVWRVPYVDAIKPIIEFDPSTSYDGRASVVYTFLRNAKLVRSDPATTIISMHRFGAECPLVRP